MSNNLTVGSFVKSERVKKGFSIPEVSKMAGVSVSTVSETENDIHLPKLNTLVKMLNALNES